MPVQPNFEPPRFLDPECLSQAAKDAAGRFWRSTGVWRWRAGKYLGRRLLPAAGLQGGKQGGMQAVPASSHAGVLFHALWLAWHAFLIPCFALAAKAISSLANLVFPLPLLGLCAGAMVLADWSVVAEVASRLRLAEQEAGFASHLFQLVREGLWPAAALYYATVFGGCVLLAALLAWGAAGFGSLALIFMRRPIGLRVLRLLCWGQVALSFLLWYWVVNLVKLAAASDALGEPGRLAAIDLLRQNFYLGLCGALGALFFCGLMATRSLMRPEKRFSDDEDDLGEALSPGWGDSAYDWLRRQSRERGIIKSWYYLGLAGFMAFLVTTMGQYFGCHSVSAYRLAAGSLPAREVVNVKKVKKKKKVLVNKNSSIIWKTPTVDEIKNDLAAATSHTYKAGVKKGKKGSTGAGIEGALFSDGEVRFLRLEHGGPGWEDGMYDSADRNMLLKFKELLGMKVKLPSEAHPARLLKEYKEFQAPPFMYITGTGGINMSTADKAALRNYLTKQGGMLFADSAGAGFAAGMNQLVKEVLPGMSWTNISNDDELFQEPFDLTGGYPILWHHTGTRMQGIKSQGRWIVIWYPGELKDAWKTGHMGVSAEVAEKAYQMGANIMYYSFKKYVEFIKAQKGEKDGEKAGGTADKPGIELRD